MEQNIVKLNYQEKEIFLVKTAHVSKNSKEDVKNAFLDINPDSICIELDEERYKSLTDKDNKWKDQDITKVIKEKKVGLLLVNIILSSFQRRMAKSLDTSSGGEMAMGISLAKEYNKTLVFADRPVNTTFQRVWNGLGFIEKTKLLVTIISSIFDNEEISEEDLQNLKQQDSLQAALNEVAKEFPNVKKALVDERDMFLAQKIKTAPGNKVMAIIGAAHSIGINKYLNEEIDTEALLEVKKKKLSLSTIIKWGIPILILFMLIYTIIANINTGIDNIKNWVIWNGTASAIGALLCKGHPLTILVSFLVAPFTSLNPVLSAGLFASLCEAYLKKPKVKDFEDIAIDTENIKGFLQNRVTRILILFVVVNVFSSLATFISGAGILDSFIKLFTK